MNSYIYYIQTNLYFFIFLLYLLINIENICAILALFNEVYPLLDNASMPWYVYSRLLPKTDMNYWTASISKDFVKRGAE